MLSRPVICSMPLDGTSGAGGVLLHAIDDAHRMRIQRRDTSGSILALRCWSDQTGGLRPAGPPVRVARGGPMPRSAPAGAPVARLVRYAARLQRVQDSRCEPHNGLKAE